MENMDGGGADALSVFSGNVVETSHWLLELNACGMIYSVMAVPPFMAGNPPAGFSRKVATAFFLPPHFPTIPHTPGAEVLLNDHLSGERDKSEVV